MVPLWGWSWRGTLVKVEEVKNLYQEGSALAVELEPHPGHPGHHPWHPCFSISNSITCLKNLSHFWKACCKNYRPFSDRYVFMNCGPENRNSADFSVKRSDDERWPNIIALAPRRVQQKSTGIPKGRTIQFSNAMFDNKRGCKPHWATPFKTNVARFRSPESCP